MKCRNHITRGLGMVEAVFSVILVGGLVVVSLDTLGASTVAQRDLGDRAVGELLAGALMSEILNQNYKSPNNELEGVLQPEGRFAFDDVDDYDGWSASPPENRDGSVIPSLAGWRQNVDVVFTHPANLNINQLADSGVKRVTVTITRRDVVVAALVAVKSGSNGLEDLWTQTE